MSAAWILGPIAAAVIGAALLVAAVVRIVRRERAAEAGLDDRTDDGPWPP